MDNLVWFDESLRGILVVDFGIVSWYNFELDNWILWLTLLFAHVLKLLILQKNRRISTQNLKKAQKKQIDRIKMEEATNGGIKNGRSQKWRTSLL